MIVKDEKGNVIVDDETPFNPKPGTVERMGYHKSPYHQVHIKKGVIGEISKIEEELAELKDAEAQDIKIMVMIELSDVYGALEFYVEKQGLTMEDVKKFSDLNKKVKSEE